MYRQIKRRKTDRELALRRHPGHLLLGTTAEALGLSLGLNSDLFDSGSSLALVVEVLLIGRALVAKDGRANDFGLGILAAGAVRSRNGDHSGDEESDDVEELHFDSKEAGRLGV